MKYAIGYQLPDDDFSTPALVRDYREHVSEVYFALPGHPSGRTPLGLESGIATADARRIMHRELGELAEMGVGLVLLLNASCYGDGAVAADLVRSVEASVEDLLARHGLRSVTTASPVVARAVKAMKTGVRVHASVNMRVGTVRAMECLAGDFDGYYLQREHNRNLEHIDRLKTWCGAHGKDLLFLANSGCLRDCPWQTFHDNLVAHEAGVRRRANVPSRYPSPCWEFLHDRRRWPVLLQNTWVRPEDVHRYQRWFGTMKLATRMHAAPRRVLDAYARGRYRGSLLDLMEPGYGPLLHPYIVDNSRFPDDFFDVTSACTRDCSRCTYCADVLERVLVNPMSA